MSKLTFQHKSGIITLTSSEHKIVGVWRAHNNVARSSNGPWPVGTYPWSHYNFHAEAGLAPAGYHAPYGRTGIHVFTVHGREGLGVHAGRTLGGSFQLGGVTNGCIRVPTEAMQTINDTHRADPIQEITVE
jgi:hypothetical protein